MARQKSRIVRCASLAGLFVLTSAMSTARASAETLELVCTWNSEALGEWHVSVDMAERKVRESFASGNVWGPFEASVSDAYIRWNSPAVDAQHIAHANTIDRSTGTLTDQRTWNDGMSQRTESAKCRRASNKF